MSIGGGGGGAEKVNGKGKESGKGKIPMEGTMVTSSRLASSSVSKRLRLLLHQSQRMLSFLLWHHSHHSKGRPLMFLFEEVNRPQGGLKGKEGAGSTIRRMITTYYLMIQVIAGLKR